MRERDKMLHSICGERQGGSSGEMVGEGHQHVQRSWGSQTVGI